MSKKKNKKENKESNKISEAINLLLKMREDGRMDEEEFHLLLEVIFSDNMDEETFLLIKFMFKHRPKDDFWLKPYTEPLQVSPKIHYYD